MKKALFLNLCVSLSAILAPAAARACACGCGIFDVGTSSMFPAKPGGMMFLDYNYQDQNRNWSGSSRAPAANNDDKEIRTHFITFGAQYLFNRNWGLQLEVPLVNRYFKKRGDAGDIVSRNWTDLGDLRLKGIYTGFSEDLSTGVTFGFKLPSGNFRHDPDFVDRDTQIGSGSTDVLLGGFHRQSFTPGSKFKWFAQAEVDVPFLIQDQYRPGVEVDAAMGAYYEGWSLGKVKITPVAQVLGSVRTRDTGANSASPVASGYQRILLSPGIEFALHPVSLYADVELPVYEHVTGNQIVAPVLIKVVLSYHF